MRPDGTRETSHPAVSSRLRSRMPARFSTTARFTREWSAPSSFAERAPMSSIAETVTLAAPSFTGQLLRPDDPDYDAVRRVHNGLIDKHPALIARCHGVADIVDAVRLARTNGLDVSIRGGGHNVGGRGTVDDGGMIDLSPMKGIHVARS